jgi:hypothetical protein
LDNVSKLSLSRQGAWIVNASKHLLSVADVTHPGLSTLDNIIFAGKCGSLLIKLSADETERLTSVRVRAHARLCGIGGPELKTYVDILNQFGCLDFDVSRDTYEVLAFSRQRVLEHTAEILATQIATPIELSLIPLLEYCLLRPRLESEVKELLAGLLSEEDSDHLLRLIRNFELLGTIKIDNRGEYLYFNGYQFGDRAHNIGKCLSALSADKKDQLNQLLEMVSKHPGTPPENVGVPGDILRLAVGLGLIEESQVHSGANKATFLTTPHFAPPSVGKETEHLEDDVFHHAKMLLASFKYGELRSSFSRGRIMDPQILIRSLLGRGEIGPCTAIGQDYVLLEGEGVIRTHPAKDKPGNQFYMGLRRSEPAEMVLGLIESGVSGDIDTRSLPRSLLLPGSFQGPETHRPAAFRKTASADGETLERFLRELRT